jgi:uncharacterized membrane protein YqaE (UPF0057 family)
MLIMNTNVEPRLEINTRGLEMEYASLRGEILKRIEMRQQIVSITLTLAGIFLGIGIGTQSVALVYPPLAMFLAFGWAQNDFRIRDLAYYIRVRIEPNVPGAGYEGHVHEQRDHRKGLGSWRFIILSHGGIFLVTQLLAIGIGLSNFASDAMTWVLLGIDVLTAGTVVWLMKQASTYETAHRQ